MQLPKTTSLVAKLNNGSRTILVLLSLPPLASAATTALTAATAAAAAALLVIRLLLVLLLLPHRLIVRFLQLPVVFPECFILWSTPERACRQSQHI
jgi:hypothetical protein